MLPLLLPLALSGISALSGAFGNKQKTTSSTQLAPEFTGLRDALIPMLADRLRSSVDLSGMEANNTAGINKTYANVGQGLTNNLTARGLGSSPIADASRTRLSIARAGDINQMKNTLPLIQEQIQGSRLAQALAGLNLGYDSGTRTTIGTSGGGLGGMFGGLGGMLGFLYGQGAFGDGGGAGGGRVPLNFMGDLSNYA